MPARLKRLLENPPPGPFREGFWRSPIRGPWLASVLSSALLPLIVICAVTGFVSHAAYDPELGSNSVTGPSPLPIELLPFDWPATWPWLYAVNQGLHVVAGIAAIPILLAKLWAVIPKLFEWPPVRSVAHALERLSLALLVGGSLWVLFSGVLNIQLFYPWPFPFVPAHYYGAIVFLGALLFHLVIKLPVVAAALRERGLTPLREDAAHTEPEPPLAALGEIQHTSAPAAPGPTTVSRRALLGTVAAGSAGLVVLTAGQSIGGPLRQVSILAPRGREYGDGPNDFPVNKTAQGRGITEEMVGSSWRLTLVGSARVELSREQLLALPQRTHTLPIACVEGWSSTQDWTGVPLRDLATLAGVPADRAVFVQSLQEGGSFRKVTLNPGQVADSRSLLALKVNEADLSLDHGFPARIIVPALPGVHCTKWVSSLDFTKEA
ncbi:MAG: molybdopterin-dependent oxidoreductase [Solirubrobacterales bacterium]